MMNPRSTINTGERRSLIHVSQGKQSERRKMQETIEIQETQETQETQQTQNIFLIFRGGPPETEAPTGAPTPRPLTRDFNYRSCQQASDKSILAGVADVHFVYDVETTNELKEGEERAMLNALEAAMIDSVFESACRRRPDETSRELGIHFISSGNQDKLRGECAVTDSEATSCLRYDGSVKVGYIETGQNSSELDAGKTALKVVSSDMSSNSYIESMNVALEDFDISGMEDANITSPMVTRVTYVGTSFYNVTTSPVIVGVSSSNWVAEEGSMTLLGKVLVAILSCLIVGLITVMYLGYKSHRARRRLGRLAVLRAKEDNLYHNHQKPDHLGADLKHLAEGVQRCKKANCMACTQQLPLGGLDDTQSTEEYHQCVEVTDVEDGQCQSIISGLTGPHFGHNSIFGRKQKREPVIEVIEPHNEERNDTVDAFADEPRTVRFVKVEDHARSLAGPELLGAIRKIAERSGGDKSEVEL